MKAFSIISLGCPRNLSDSEYIISEFKRKGHVYQDEIIGCDTVIVNTCGFIEDAKKESIDIILKVIDAKKAGDIKKIIVAGCLSERYKKDLKKSFKEVDEFRGIVDFKSTFGKGIPEPLTPKHYKYLKISEGCVNQCTYCIIPCLKGPYKSKPFEIIKKEVEYFIKRGVQEIILIGQDTSLYGIDLYRKKQLAFLLKSIDGISSGNWIRLLYCHPYNLDKDVIKVIKNSKNICKYIDLPIEHISADVLKSMGRKTNQQDILSLIEYIRKEIPNAALRTSVIVGFPGETEKDFQELKRFIQKIRFERLGLFRYSREEGTPAYKFKGQVPEKEKQSRFDEIMLLQQGIAGKNNERFKNKVLKALVEEKEEDCYIGRSEYDAPEVDGLVYVRGKDLKIGTFVDVKIIDTYEYDLVGEIV